jgi:mRNA-degrading endonuclease RelE of RelBE toxin-antitoxin system
LLLIADTFRDSLARLTSEEQKAVKMTAFDLQMNPAQPGMQCHKLERARDQRFWSIRVSRDIRVIVHRSGDTSLLCYVDHHDKAYLWAEKRKLETHPRTGAAQLVEIRETVQEILIPQYVPSEQPSSRKPSLFAEQTDEELLGFGVPLDWLADVKAVDEDGLFELVPHLPSEASEALLELATGGTPFVSTPTNVSSNPFEHPDAQRRFRLMTNVNELKQALDYPWERWTVFLHPAQRALVERSYKGPARVAGSAGTGKTVVAIHRAVVLARKYPEAQVLLTTFSPTLSKALQARVRVLLGSDSETLDRITVRPLSDVAYEILVRDSGEPNVISEASLRELLFDAAKQAGPHRFTDAFLWAEWNEIIDAWQIDSWEGYRDVPRLGRKTRLGEAQRMSVWSIFDHVKQSLNNRHLLTMASLLARVTDQMTQQSARPFDFAVVDEAQDIGVSELRFLAALGANKPDCLFFAGDLGQRIFQPPFSWKSLGVDIRGRSKTLHINYRTSHQIRVQADKLLPLEVSDVDGNSEDRTGTISAFDGIPPDVHEFSTIEEETENAASWLTARTNEGLRPHEIGIFVRSEAEFPRARQVADAAGLKAVVLTDTPEPIENHAAILTMHLAKGLEFRAVLVLACDDEIIPLQERVTAIVDDSDLQEVYNTERHLLYVACTRARDFLMVCGVEPASEFLDDLMC